MPENFKYESLKSKSPPVLEGDFTYNQASLRMPSPAPEGSFNYEHLKTTVEKILLGWFVIPWFSDWFGSDWFGGDVFTYEHQRLIESAPVEGSSFEFENLKPVTPPVILNDDFKYKRV
jgi:hypothetical protein